VIQTSGASAHPAQVAVYFTSDHHFGHSGARSLYRRPFASVADMDREMTNRWNSVIGPQEEVWYLGDFAVRQSAERVASLLDTLHGRKHLITGNNDDAAVTDCGRWASIQPYAEVSVGGISLVLCHYPLRTWRDMSRGWVNLHGHSHGRLKPMSRQYDVGVDVWNFRPVLLTQLLGKGRRSVQDQ
jgi:calcineurin-like phosphoesterase family protein